MVFVIHLSISLSPSREFQPIQTVYCFRTSMMHISREELLLCPFCVYTIPKSLRLSLSHSLVLCRCLFLSQNLYLGPDALDLLASSYFVVKNSSSSSTSPSVPLTHMFLHMFLPLNAREDLGPFLVQHLIVQSRSLPCLARQSRHMDKFTKLVRKIVCERRNTTLCIIPMDSCHCSETATTKKRTS